MFEGLKSAVTGYEFISMLALFTYWIPLIICLTVYFFRFIGAYKEDLKLCTKEYYTPKLTLGVIVWYVVISVIPCINLFALVFDCASSAFRWFGRALDFPLVRKKGL